MKKICRVLGLKAKRIELYAGKFEGHRKKAVVGVSS